MLEIKNLCASIEGKKILNGLNLHLEKGKVYAIMGPNGTGKSTLGKIVAGDQNYEITEGEIIFDIHRKKKDILKMESEERAKNGIFLGFQYPVELPGISNEIFLQTAFNEICEYQGVPQMDIFDFRKLLQEKMKALKIKEDFLQRFVNVGFSGGEKKKNELLQVCVLNPKLIFLDEIDSGLDIDSLRIIGETINTLRSKENTFVLVTHYKRILEIVKPDVVLVFYGGRIVKSGDATLADEIEAKGYDVLSKEGNL